jgi:hypothetical protein
VFGWAFLPVRVEASLTDPVTENTLWNDMEVTIYTGRALKEVPEEQWSKKEVQLAVNLKQAMEALGESLLDAGMTRSVPWEHRLPVQEEMNAPQSAIVAGVKGELLHSCFMSSSVDLHGERRAGCAEVAQGKANRQRATLFRRSGSA